MLARDTSSSMPAPGKHQLQHSRLDPLIRNLLPRLQVSIVCHVSQSHCRWNDVIISYADKMFLNGFHLILRRMTPHKDDDALPILTVSAHVLLLPLLEHSPRKIHQLTMGRYRGILWLGGQVLAFIGVFVCVRYTLPLVWSIKNVTNERIEKQDVSTQSVILRSTHFSQKEREWKHTKYPVLIKPKLKFSRKEQEKVGPGRPPNKVVHECACTKQGKSEKATKPPPSWLQIPDAAVSFFVSYYALAFEGITLDYDVGDDYLEELPQRYPVEIYSKDTVLLNFSTVLDVKNLRHTVTIFQDPSDRLVSAYKSFSAGVNITEFPYIRERCRSNDDIECFAAHEGVAHCLTKAMLGYPCYSTIPVDHTSVDAAIENMKKMPFIGLATEWNEAVCQFHQMFGGKPPQTAFLSYKKNRESQYLKDFRQSYRDELDEAVYEAAKMEFERRYLSTTARRCYRETIDAPQSLRTKCWPQTCQNLGRQCGEWPDGCGGVLVCGRCPQHRAGLPEPWHAECTNEGRCLIACPWWVESGLWYPESSRVLSDRHELEGGPFDLDGNEYDLYTDYLPPTDAIWMCAEACLSIKNKTMAFAEKYCKCGKAPSGFLAEALMATEYQALMEVKKGPDPIMDTSRNRLTAENSQPLCCREIQISMDFQWKEGTIDADYYATYDMGGCSGRAMCAQLGRVKGAQVVTFTESSKLCRFGKNLRRKVVIASSFGTIHRFLDD